MASQMLTICVEGNDEPLGFIEITSTSTLSDARESILSELEGLPEHFRFVVPSPTGAMIKLSLVQETKRAAHSFMPQITIREVPPEGPQGSLRQGAIAAEPAPPAASPPPTAAPIVNVEPARPISPTVTSPLDTVTHKDLQALDLNATHVPQATSKRTSWHHSKPATDHHPHQETDSSSNSNNVLKLAQNRKTRIPLDHPLNDSGIDTLWEYFFEKRPISRVRLDEVPFALYAILQEKCDSERDEFKALQALVINLGPHAFGSNDNREEYENPKQVFNKILKTFGPLDGILNRITNMLKLKEYHGNITSRAAEDAVRRQPVGTYLLRLSNSSPGSLAFTVRTNDTQVHNYLVERTPDFKFTLGKDTFDTIEEVIQRNMKRLRFKTPAKDSPFKRTFDNNDVARAYTSFDESTFGTLLQQQQL